MMDKYELSDKAIEASDGKDLASANTYLLEAQVYAALALVDAQREANEQARIANIIAFYAAPEVDGLISREEYQTMGKRIREALGL